MKKKNDKKSKSATTFSIIFTIAGLLWSLYSLNETAEGSGVSYIFIVFVVAVILIVIFAIAGKKDSAKKAENDDEFELSDDEFMLTDEDFDDEDGEMSASDKKRLEQLDNMLKNGIIDRAEYKMMLKRYGLD